MTYKNLFSYFFLNEIHLEGYYYTRDALRAVYKSEKLWMREGIVRFLSFFGYLISFICIVYFSGKGVFDLGISVWSVWNTYLNMLLAYVLYICFNAIWSMLFASVIWSKHKEKLKDFPAISSIRQSNCAHKPSFLKDVFKRCSEM